MNSKRYDGVYYSGREVFDLKQLIVESCELYPDNNAYLVHDKEKDQFVPIKYHEVKADLDAFGTRLVDLGLKNKKIAVIGETSYYWLLTYYATVTGVGVIVPLDRNLPEGELKGLIERSGAEAIVYSEKCEKTIKFLFDDPKDIRYFISMNQQDHEGNVLSMPKLIKEGRGLVENGNRDFIDVDIDPDQLSTIIFTSGTTGLAKGVMLSHRNIAQQCYQMSKFFKIPEPGIVLSILPVHHVYEMTCDIFTTFYQGKTIAICEGIRYIMKDMNEVHANVMLGVPLVFEKMYKGMWKQAKRRGEEEKLRRAIDLSKRLGLYNNRPLIRRMFASIHNSFGGDMRSFVVGGAAADPYIIEEFEAMGIPMVQGYGMTENAPIISLNPDRYRKAAATGKPLPGTTVRIVDQDEDGIGEIICKGPSVMMGYYENEEATEETIRNGWLRTGDLGYFDDDGFLYVTGRKKTVIVTKGGKNIFPEEVEDVLLQNELIKEVLVHGVKDDRVGNVMVTADIYPNYDLLKEQQGNMSRSEIYHFYRDLVDDINETMPPYKQVKRINIRTEEFIKTTTGKIKRFANKLGSGDSIEKMDYPDIKKIELRTAKARAKELSESQDPMVRYHSVRAITDLRNMISGSEKLYGENIAIVDRFGPDKDYIELTYRQLKADIDGLGTAMMNRGITGRIALVGKMNYEWQVSFLTIMGGVGVAVPLSASLDRDKMIRQLNEAEVTAVLVEESDAELLKDIVSSGETDVKTLIVFGPKEHYETPDDSALSFHVLLDEGKKQVGQGDRQFIDAEVIASQMAMILYTSRTGKAVMLSHENISADLMAVSTMVNITPEDRVFSPLLATRVYQSTLGFLLPLYKGAAVINGADPERLTQDMEISKPTVFLGEPETIVQLQDQLIGAVSDRHRGAVERLMDTVASSNAVGTFFQVGLNRPALTELKKRAGGNLRLIVSVGDAVSTDLLQFFNAIGITAIRGYCLAECGPVAAINPDNPRLARPESCGHLLPGMSVKVLEKDSYGIGEICVKGPNVMLGYYNDEEMTDAALQNGWLRTGDTGYVDDNDFIYLVDREELPHQGQPSGGGEQDAPSPEDEGDFEE